GLVVVCVREREARIVRSLPPNVKPAARPDPSGPPRIDRWEVSVTVASGSPLEGPDGSGVNGLTPGPCHSSSCCRRQARGLP
ncbi:MAG: hypothetical protein ACREXR_22735, partial [Gammaproteobacteria bacterium]